MLPLLERAPKRCLSGGVGDSHRHLELELAIFALDSGGGGGWAASPRGACHWDTGAWGGSAELQQEAKPKAPALTVGAHTVTPSGGMDILSEFNTADAFPGKPCLSEAGSLVFS